MPSLNRVQLIGHLGKDPESRLTPTGKKVVHFSVAVDRRWKNVEGEIKQDTDWFNIEVWGKLGDVCECYLQKGRLVYLEGRLQTDRFEQAGEVKYFTKVVVRYLQMLDRKPEEEIEAVVEPLEEEPPVD
jgi:single-strand DNA-binding protein